MTDISLLLPKTGDRAGREMRERTRPIVREIVMHAAARGSEDIMLELYLAGLWHDSELARQRLIEEPKS